MKDNKEFILEYFVEDQNLVNEYKEHLKPIRNRFKYTLFWDTLVIYMSFQYVKNLDYYLDKFFPKRVNTFGCLMKVSSLHTFTFFALIIAGNCAILGIRPIKWLKKTSELNRRMNESGNNPNMTWGEFKAIIEKTQINVDTIMDENKKI